jgi:hypothetical protein
LATKHNSVAIIQQLLSAGANMFIESKSNYCLYKNWYSIIYFILLFLVIGTPLDVANCCRNNDALKLLSEHEEQAQKTIQMAVQNDIKGRLNSIFVCMVLCGFLNNKKQD